MKKLSFILFIIILIFCLISCTPQEPAEAEKIEVSLSSFYYANSGSMIEDFYSFAIVQTDDGAHLTANLNSGQDIVEADVPKEVLSEAEDIVNKYNAASWDGFDETDDKLLDGSGFTLELTTVEGREIYAHGYGATPPLFSDAKYEFKMLLDRLVYEYGDLYPKTLESDELISAFINITDIENNGGSRFYLSVYDNPEGADDISITFEDMPDYFEEDYYFYGQCEEFDFDGLQEIIRKYDVPSWNGMFFNIEGPAEWMQAEFYYETDEQISIMGSDLPENYPQARAEIVDFVYDFVLNNSETFTED